MQPFSELKARGNSTLFEGEAAVVTVKKKRFKWGWKVCRGYCKKELQLRPEAGVAGKLKYFDTRKYFGIQSKCILQTIQLACNFAG